jgi:hypothetical protein
MNDEQIEKISQAFLENSELSPDKSTEYLIQFTADSLGVDYGRVVTALAIAWDEQYYHEEH